MKPSLLAVLGPLSLSTLVAPALAQNDDCAGAIAVTLGSTTFDTTLATVSAPAWPCASAGASDLWFSFTAPNTSLYSFDTCGSTYDTAIELFTGSCGTLVSESCNDDSCGLESAIAGWSLNAGDVVLLRVGGWQGATGSGSLTVTELPPLPGPSGSIPSWLSEVNTGTTPSYVGSLFTGPAVVDIGPTNGADGVTYEVVVYGDSTGISTGLIGARNTGVGDSVGLKFEQWADSLQYGITDFGVLDYYYPGSLIEQTDIHMVFVADTTLGTTNLYVNGQLQGTVGIAPVLSGLQGIGQIHDPTFGEFDVMSLGRVHGVAIYEGLLTPTEIQAHHDAYFINAGIEITCDPASDHYLGAYAKLDTSAFGSGVGSDLHIEVTDGPDGEFGFLLISPDGSVALNIFNGVLCLNAPQGRYNPLAATNQGLPELNSLGQFDATGVMQNLAGTATSSGGTGFDVPLELPFTPAGQVIAPGDTYSFQCWFRDQIPPFPNPGSSANFSNVIEVTFP